MIFSKSVGEQEQLLKFQKIARHVVVKQATDTHIIQVDAPRPLLGRQQRPQWLRGRRCSTPCAKSLLCKLVKSTSTTPKPRLYDDDVCPLEEHGTSRILENPSRAQCADVSQRSWAGTALFVKHVPGFRPQETR